MKYNTPEKIIEFTDLKTWQSAHELTINIYKFSKYLPKDEIFGLTSQIRRSLTETKNHILLALDLKYLSQDQSRHLMLLASETQALLQGLLKSTKLKIS